MVGWEQWKGLTVCVGGERRWESRETSIYRAHTVPRQLCWEHILAHRNLLINHNLQVRFYYLYRGINWGLEWLRHSVLGHKWSEKKWDLNLNLCFKSHPFSVLPLLLPVVYSGHYITVGRARPLLFLLTKCFLPWLSAGPRETFSFLSLLPPSVWGSGLVTQPRSPVSQALLWSGCPFSPFDRGPMLWSPYRIRSSNLLRSSPASSH